MLGRRASPNRTLRGVGAIVGLSLIDCDPQQTVRIRTWLRERPDYELVRHTRHRHWRLSNGRQEITRAFLGRAAQLARSGDRQQAVPEIRVARAAAGAVLAANAAGNAGHPSPTAVATGR